MQDKLINLSYPFCGLEDPLQKANDLICAAEAPPLAKPTGPISGSSNPGSCEPGSAEWSAVVCGDEADGARVAGGSGCIYMEGRTVRAEPGEKALGSVERQIPRQPARDFACFR